ncbi:unnamed protein product [Peronospora belbahrii]|uniref:Chromo domain-containing protein n=1 Tax=Peronospora belbahrii TaxID=622444 RepID=A0ABN8CTD2_9STRA|nr:unnamed protein product [Peronospora belbahrii]
MPTDIERIVDRKLIKQRVHYYVMWKGFGEDNNTWESRIDLMADGYSNIIKRFEEQRKKESGKSTSSRGRSPGRLLSKSPRTSKSPGRGASRSKGRRSRSRSVSGSRKLHGKENDDEKNKKDMEKDTIHAVSMRRRNYNSKNKKKNQDKDHGVDEELSRRQMSQKLDTMEISSVTQFVSRLDEQKPDVTTDEEDDSVLLRSTMAVLTPRVRESISPVALEKDVHKKSVVLSYEQEEEPLLKAQKRNVPTCSSKVTPIHDRTDRVQNGLITKAVESGYLASFLSVAAVVGSLVASQMLPRNDEEGADLWRRWLPFLTPVVALLLFFHQKDARKLAKWVATGLAWRAAAELLLLIEDTPREFEMLIAGSAIFANVSLLIALVSILINGEHEHFKATLTLLAVGTLTLFLSDSWAIATGNAKLESRVILMSVAVMTIALSPLPTASAEDDH